MRWRTYVAAAGAVVITLIAVIIWMSALPASRYTDTYLGVSFAKPRSWSLRARDLPDVKALYPNSRSELWLTKRTSIIFIVDTSSRLYHDDTEVLWNATTTESI